MTMASKTLVPVQEYLRMSFDGPDREYVDGEIIERHLGSTPHSKAQRRLNRFLESLSDRHSLHPLSDIRVKISGSRYRVPDIAVFFGGEPVENIPSTPPFIVIEVVSEDDRYTEIRKKLAEFHAWGVKHIWLADPWTQTLSVYDGAGLHEVPRFELQEFGATLSPEEIFS
jgi:Uma2 family endonuclease